MEVAKTDTSFVIFKVPDIYLGSIFFCYSCNM